jgi:hypothetical protein
VADRCVCGGADRCDRHFHPGARTPLSRAPRGRRPGKSRLLRIAHRSDLAHALAVGCAGEESTRDILSSSAQGLARGRRFGLCQRRSRIPPRSPDALLAGLRRVTITEGRFPPLGSRILARYGDLGEMEWLSGNAPDNGLGDGASLTDGVKRYLLVTHRQAGPPVRGKARRVLDRWPRTPAARHWPPGEPCRGRPKEQTRDRRPPDRQTLLGIDGRSIASVTIDKPPHETQEQEAADRAQTGPSDHYLPEPARSLPLAMRPCPARQTNKKWGQTRLATVWLQ